MGFGHHRLSVFGIADAEELALVKPVARALLARDALRADDFGGLSFGPNAKPILKGEAKVEIVLPPKRTRRRGRKAAGVSARSAVRGAARAAPRAGRRGGRAALRHLPRQHLARNGGIEADHDPCFVARLGRRRRQARPLRRRPDGEEPDQPTAADLETAAKAAGLGYSHIPVGLEFSADKVAAMAEALTQAEGRVLIFCRSGTRAAYLWALARAREGAEAGDLIRQAAHAGYNIRPLLPWLKRRDD